MGHVEAFTLLPPQAAVPEERGCITVTVALAGAPRQVQQVVLQLPAGCTAAQALQASGLLATLDDALLATLSLALWGKVCTGSTLLHDHDRLELLRPLIVDPKEARRQRYRRDGVRKVARRAAAAPPAPVDLSG